MENFEIELNIKEIFNFLENVTIYIENNGESREGVQNKGVNVFITGGNFKVLQNLSFENRTRLIGIHLKKAKNKTFLRERSIYSLITIIIVNFIIEIIIFESF